MKLQIREELIDGKEYIFRGESNNKYQSNYSKKNKLRFETRFYSYEVFDGIYKFGNVAVYELLKPSRIWDYGEGVEEFIDEFDLSELDVPELYKVYKIKSLSELEEYGGDKIFNYHDYYHAQQLVAIAYLEDNYKNSYDGIEFYECQDTPETQLAIWNSSAVKKLTYKEAKDVLLWLEKQANELGIEDSMYTKSWDGKYKYNIHR